MAGDEPAAPRARAPIRPSSSTTAPSPMARVLAKLRRIGAALSAAADARRRGAVLDALGALDALRAGDYDAVTDIEAFMETKIIEALRKAKTLEYAAPRAKAHIKRWKACLEKHRTDAPAPAPIPKRAPRPRADDASDGEEAEFEAGGGAAFEARDAAGLAVGDRLWALFEDVPGQEWWGGTILEARRDGTYDVIFDDGEPQDMDGRYCFANIDPDVYAAMRQKVPNARAKAVLRRHGLQAAGVLDLRRPRKRAV